MADVGALDQVMIRVPSSDGGDDIGQGALRRSSPPPPGFQGLHVKIDIVAVLLCVALAVVWRHRAANLALAALLDVLFERAYWTALLASLTFVPCALMMQAIRSIKFQLYLLAVAVLAASQVLVKKNETIGRTMAALPRGRVRRAAAAIWLWLAAFVLVEAANSGLQSRSPFLTAALGVLALLASVKSLLRRTASPDHASSDAYDARQ